MAQPATARPDAPRLGVTFTPNLPPERLQAVAQATEAHGLDELWLWEDCFKESGIACAAAALAWTRRIAVGIGLMPAPLRNVALTAMEVATLCRLFPRRFVAGIGHGVQDWMGQVGGRVASPMTLLQEYAVCLRRLLAGEEVTVQGRFVQLDQVQLEWPPLEPPRLMLGGEGPKTCALAGRLGDGTLLAGLRTDAEVRSVCERVAAARSGLAALAVPGRHEVTATLLVATGPGAADRVQADVRACGRDPDLGIGVGGGAAEVAAAVQRLGGLGVTSVSFVATRDEPALEGLIEFLGREVKPLVAGAHSPPLTAGPGQAGGVRGAFGVGGRSALLH